MNGNNPLTTKHEGAVSENQALPGLEGLNRERLNELIQQSSQKGAYFGRGVELTDEDRVEFSRIADAVDSYLEPKFEDPDWIKLQDLVEEGESKGVLMSFTNHKGTNVPTWCVDGGEDAVVRKVMRHTEHGSSAGIEVPSRIFNLFHWKSTADHLRDFTKQSNETINGRSAKSLALTLRHLGHLFKSDDK